MVRMGLPQARNCRGVSDDSGSVFAAGRMARAAGGVACGRGRHEQARPGDAHTWSPAASQNPPF